MALVCCVDGCDSMSKDDVTYFPFPIKPSLRRRWCEAVKARSLPAAAAVCERHFARADTALVRGKLRLNASVVPTVFDGAMCNPPKSPKAPDKDTLPDTAENSNSNSTTSGTDSHQPTTRRKSARTRKKKRERSKENERTSDRDDDTPLNKDADSKDQDAKSKDQDAKSKDQDAKSKDQDANSKDQDAKSKDDHKQAVNENGDAATETNNAVTQINDAVTETSDTVKEIVSNQAGDTEMSDTVKESVSNDAETESSDKIKERVADKVDNSDLEDTESANSDVVINDTVRQSDKYDDSDVIECYPNIDLLLNVDIDSMDGGSADDVEKCTVECVPEAVLGTSESESEEMPKEDIEDIIANYHIRRDKKLAERLKAAQSVTTDKQPSSATTEPQASNPGLELPRPSPTPSVGLIEVEVPALPDRFVEINVDTERPAADSSDCLLLLENVQVDIDPASLLPEPADDDDDDSSSVEEVAVGKEDPISLLTSSDDDDVILEEPQIDTVEVSDEDEDDIPLVQLVKEEGSSTGKPTIGQLLWGTYEYYCYQCHYKTMSRSDYQNHKSTHSKVILMCEICHFSTASEVQFVRHKKKHKGEKSYKCHLCEYKAKHKMSLVYHLKSHENVDVTSLTWLKEGKNYDKTKKGYKCNKCKCTVKFKADAIRHSLLCKKDVSAKNRMHACGKCSYSTKRRSDLRRHRNRQHADDVDVDVDDEDYEPPAYASILV